MGGSRNKESKISKEEHLAKETQIKKIEELLHTQIPEAVLVSLRQKSSADLNEIAKLLAKMHPEILTIFKNSPANLIRFNLDTLFKLSECTPEIFARINNNSNLAIKAFFYHIKNITKENFSEEIFETNLKFAIDFRNYGDTSLSEKSKVERSATLLMLLANRCYIIGEENNFNRIYMEAANKAYNAVPKESSLYDAAQKSKYLGYNPLFRLAQSDLNEAKFYAEFFETLEFRESHLNAEDENGYTAAHRVLMKYKTLVTQKIFYKAFLVKLLMLPHPYKVVPNDKMRVEEGTLLNEVEKELTEQAMQESAEQASRMHEERAARAAEASTLETIEDASEDDEPGRRPSTCLGASNSSRSLSSSGSLGSSGLVHSFASPESAAAAANTTALAEVIRTVVPVGVASASVGTATAAAAAPTAVVTATVVQTPKPSAATITAAAKPPGMLPYSSRTRPGLTKKPSSCLFEIADKARTIQDLDSKRLSEYLEAAEGGQKSNLDEMDPRTGLTAAETLFRRYQQLMSPNDRENHTDYNFYCYLLSKGATCQQAWQSNFGNSMGSAPQNSARPDVKSNAEAERVFSSPTFAIRAKSLHREPSSPMMCPGYHAKKSTKRLYLTEEAARNPAFHLATQKTLSVRKFISDLIKPEAAAVLLSKLTSKTLKPSDFTANLLKPGIKLNELYNGKTAARYLLKRFEDIFHSKLSVSTEPNPMELFKNILVALGADPNQAWQDDCLLVKLSPSVHAAHAVPNRLSAAAARF